MDEYKLIGTLDPFGFDENIIPLFKQPIFESCDHKYVFGNIDSENGGYIEYFSILPDAYISLVTPISEINNLIMEIDNNSFKIGDESVICLKLGNNTEYIASYDNMLEFLETNNFANVDYLFKRDIIDTRRELKEAKRNQKLFK